MMEICTLGSMILVMCGIRIECGVLLPSFYTPPGLNYESDTTMSPGKEMGLELFPV